jgi:hypothetical protein
MQKISNRPKKYKKKPKIDIKLHTLHTIKEKFLQNFEKALGIISTACKLSDIERKTYYNWIEKDADFKARCKAVEEFQLDFVESKHLELIRDLNPANIIFHLKTKGRKRGYNESIEISTPEPIKVTYVRESYPIEDAND